MASERSRPLSARHALLRLLYSHLGEIVTRDMVEDACGRSLTRQCVHSAAVALRGDLPVMATRSPHSGYVLVPPTTED
jgi:hypothetical protein